MSDFSLQALFEMFGSSFVVKDDSAYKGVIRTQKKKKRLSATKARADTLKMKDVLRTTFTTLGNPVSFTGIPKPC